MIYKIFRRWIPLAFLATILCGLVFLAVQQSLRQGADDPQIQMAEDAAAQLQTGTSTKNVIPGTPVNINTSLDSYFVIYGSTGNPTAGNGILNNAMPSLPAGVFQYVYQHGEDRFTWQPEPGIREAAVVAKVHLPPSLVASTSFVMVARSLRDVEIQEGNLEFEVGAAWIVALIGLLALEILFAFIESRRS